MRPAANYGLVFTVTLLNCYKEFLKFLIGINRDCISGHWLKIKKISWPMSSHQRTTCSFVQKSTSRRSMQSGSCEEAEAEADLVPVAEEASWRRESRSRLL